MQTESCQRHARHRGGFTLVELMVTVAIIATLASVTAVLVPGVRERSHRTVCAGNIRQQVAAMGSYASDHNNRMFWPSTGSGDEGWIGGTAKNSSNNGAMTSVTSGNDVAENRVTLDTHFTDLATNAPLSEQFHQKTGNPRSIRSPPVPRKKPENRRSKITGFWDKL